MARSRKNKVKIRGIIRKRHDLTMGEYQAVVETDDGEWYFLESGDGLLDLFEWCNSHVVVYGHLSGRGGKNHIIVSDIREEENRNDQLETSGPECF